MNRTVRTLLGLLTIGLVALTSCKKEPEKPQNEGTTYVSVAINLQSSLRAGDSGDDKEFNYKGTWNGKDAIETIAVYVVGDGEVSYGQYTMADFDVVKATDDTNITIKSNKAILTKPGTKKVYALINAPEEITKLLEKSMPAHFNEAYAKAVAIEGMTTAQVARANAANEDLIMMSNSAECKIEIADGVTKEEAIQGPKNLAKVDVKRVVARVILTTTKDTYPIKLEDGTVLGTISNITYAVAQGEKAFYISQQKNEAGSIITPGYNFLPVVDPADKSKLTNYADQAKTYDYSDLHSTVTTPRAAIVADNLTEALEIGKKSLESSAFIFEASHPFGENGQTIANYTGGFRRGNTPYVLVRAKFTPNDNAFYNDYQKNLFKKAGHDGTFYRGEDGLLYARNKPFKSKRTNEIVPEQKYTEYKAGKVLYHVFVNPDNVAKTLDAPAYRNNIYHISVTGFKTLGLNWNPLYPEDPDTPDQKNPDPKPKDDPNTPPYVPGDFNTPKETYLAVEVNVIPWNVHSYDIELSL